MHLSFRYGKISVNFKEVFYEKILRLYFIKHYRRFCAYVFGLRKRLRKTRGNKSGHRNYARKRINYNNDLFNNRTVAENDYILQAGESYLFCIEYIATGGSRYPELNAEYLCFYYDEDVLEIVHSAEDARKAEYTLICKTIVEYTAVTVEVDEFSCYVIISAY